MLNPAGRIVGDLSIACLAADRYLIVGSGFAEEFHLRWFEHCAPPPDVFVRSAASTLAGVSIAGPRSRELLQPLVRADLAPGAFKLFQVMETAVGPGAGDPDARRIHGRAWLRGLDHARLLR